jgi:rubrerythrin
MAQQVAGVTHTPNPQYDLASVLYHALKGAQTTDTYIKDAEQEGDNELAQFFRQVQQEETMHADKAKQLLARRVKVQ